MGSNIDDAFVVEDRHSMRCLLAVAVREAVKLALIDATLADAVDAEIETSGDYGQWVEVSRRLAAEWRHDVNAIPGEVLARVSAEALAQNVACRLLGYGGWMVGGVYGGNATPREVFEASLERPDQSVIDEIAFDLGLKLVDDDDRGS